MKHNPALGIPHSHRKLRNYYLTCFGLLHYQESSNKISLPLHNFLNCSECMHFINPKIYIEEAKFHINYINSLCACLLIWFWYLFDREYMMRSLSREVPGLGSVIKDIKRWQKCVKIRMSCKVMHCFRHFWDQEILDGCHHDKYFFFWQFT